MTTSPNLGKSWKRNVVEPSFLKSSWIVHCDKDGPCEPIQHKHSNTRKFHKVEISEEKADNSKLISKKYELKACLGTVNLYFLVKLMEWDVVDDEHHLVAMSDTDSPDEDGLSSTSKYRSEWWPFIHSIEIYTVYAACGCVVNFHIAF